ncbi:membrane protein [Escherichia coli]|nr:membrane protein [Escherichia coli]KHI57364.1 membrane protein [Escherichia coli]
MVLFCMDKENSSVSKRWLITSGVAVILLTLLAFMSFPDPDVSMNRYYSWLMNVLILSVTGVMYVALSVVMVMLYFLYERNSRLLYLSVLALIIAAGIWLLRFLDNFLMMPAFHVALFVLWVFLCFLYIRCKNEMSISE